MGTRTLPTGPWGRSMEELCSNNVPGRAGLSRTGWWPRLEISPQIGRGQLFRPPCQANTLLSGQGGGLWPGLFAKKTLTAKPVTLCCSPLGLWMKSAAAILLREMWGAHRHTEPHFPTMATDQLGDLGKGHTLLWASVFSLAAWSGVLRPLGPAFRSLRSSL